MSDDHSTVLPPDNVSLLERGLERAWASLLDRCDPPFPELLNPEATPAEFLPWLAADRGVTEWEAGDAEDERRKTVELAWPIKRLAGTKKALEHAVETMLIDPKVTAWYEDDGPAGPYSFQVIGWIDRSYGADVNARLDRRLHDAKSERDSLAVTIGLRDRSTLHTGIALQIGEVTTIAPPIPNDFQLAPINYGTVISIELLESVVLYPPE